MREINVAIIGRWAFHAADFVERNKKIEGCHMVAAWDKNKESREWAENLGLRFESDLDRLLADDSIDAVIIASATSEHASLCERALRAGKHVICEKAPMVTKEEARRVEIAQRESGKLYMVSDPILRGEALKLKEMIDSGAFGEISLIHIRNAHNMGMSGELPESFYNRQEAVGGVTWDVGCHGIHMLWWFLGVPQKCVSLYGYMTEKSKESGIEDNSAVSYLFPNGAIGISEASWCGVSNQRTIDIYGSKGCAHAFGGELHYVLDDGVWQKLTADQLPGDGMKPMNMWLDFLINGVEHEEYQVQEAAAFTAMLEAAELASGDGRKV